MSIEPLTLGIIGCGLLIFLCVLGVRIAFAAAIIEGSAASPELEEGIETFCVMEAVRRSSRDGQPYDVGPLLGEVGLR